MMIMVMKMKFLVLEYLILTILFLTLYLVGLKQRRKRSIVPVNDLRYMCRTDIERMLYDGLINKGIYVTPSVRLGVYSIPLALEQFKVAIFFYPKRRTALLKRFMIKHKELYLRSTGWRVHKFSDESIQTNLEAVVQTIISNDKIKKI